MSSLTSSSCLPVGPLKFDIRGYAGGLPSLMYEPNAWSKVHNSEPQHILIPIVYKNFCLSSALLHLAYVYFPDCQHNISRWARRCWIFLCYNSRSLELNRHIVGGTNRWVSKKREYIDAKKFERLLLTSLGYEYLLGTAHLLVMQWLGEHPDFRDNPVFLGSDSYAGIVTPILAQDIINGDSLQHLTEFTSWLKSSLIIWIIFSKRILFCGRAGNEAGIRPYVNLKVRRSAWMKSTLSWSFLLEFCFSLAMTRCYLK